MNIAFLGPSGVGKGTQATLLRARRKLTHFSTGDLLRSHLADRTAIGLMARNYMNQGELVPDELVDAMVEEWVTKHPSESGILFDGFPRTHYQAKFLDELFTRLGRKLDLVVALDVTEAAVIERLSGSLVCGKCQAPFHLKAHPPARPGVCDACGGDLKQRPDDAPEIARVRLRAYRRSSGAVLEYYRNSKRLVVVDAAGSIEQVHERLAAQVFAFERQATAAIVTEAAPVTAELPSVTPARLGGLDLVLLGGPGSGKGTQAEQLSKRFNLPHISTGDLFRNNLKQNTRLGVLAKQYMERGELVPDDVTEAMVEERLGHADTGDGFLLDGFPRTLPQAEALDDMLKSLGRQLAGVIYIDVSDEDIVKRLGGRLICRGCQAPYHNEFKPPKKPGVCDACGGELYQRADDNPDTIRARLRTFHAQTEPLIEFYQRDGLLSPVSGDGGVAEVTTRTQAAVAATAQKGALHV